MTAMYLIIGLLIIAVGAFCQSSSYVPINKIKDWSWESYWIVQGVFAWLLFPLVGALLSVSGTGGSFGDLLAMMSADPKATWLTILFGALWGVGGLTFGLSMRYLGVALGQTETDDRMLALDEFISGLDKPLMFFVPVIGSASSVVASGSLLQTLSGRASKRAVPFFCAAVSDAAALMGTAMGLELSHPASAFALCYKTINGIQSSALTETEADAIKALNGNVYLTRGYTHLLLEKGTVSSGARYDEILYLDKIADDLQNAAVTLLAENPDRLPQTDDSTAQFINRFTAILSGYTGRGVLASGIWRGADTGPLHAGDTVENGFALWADSYDDQPDADRAAHKAVPIQVGLVLAGSIESIVITVNVTV